MSGEARFQGNRAEGVGSAAGWAHAGSLSVVGGGRTIGAARPASRFTPPRGVR